MRLAGRLAFITLLTTNSGFAIFIPMSPSYTPGGDIFSNTLSGSISSALFPQDQLQGNGPAIDGIQTIGNMVFTTPVSDGSDLTSTYTTQSPTDFSLSAGTYQLSAYMDVFFATSLGGSSVAFVAGSQVLTELYNSSNDLLATINAGQLSPPFSPSFAPLGAVPIELTSGNSTYVTLSSGSYYLAQIFTGVVDNVSDGETITMSLPNTSGLESAPEPGTGTSLALGLAAFGIVVFAKRRTTAR
jgi:hypothetical protein